jgi:hypothetical protein
METVKAMEFKEVPLQGPPPPTSAVTSKAGPPPPPTSAVTSNVKFAMRSKQLKTPAPTGSGLIVNARDDFSKMVSREPMMGLKDPPKAAGIPSPGPDDFSTMGFQEPKTPPARGPPGPNRGLKNIPKTPVTPSPMHGYSSRAPLTLSAVQGTSGLVIGAGGEFAKMGNMCKRPSKPQAHITTDVPEFKDGETISAHGDIDIAAGDDGHEWMSAHDDIDIAASKDGHEEVWVQYTEVETPTSTLQQRSLQFCQIWRSITNTMRPLNLPITYYS